MSRFAFLSGLPRTGSTLLSTLLAQHPDLHTTPTSILRDLVKFSSMAQLGESLYFDKKDPNSQLWGIVRGILQGAYADVPNEVIIEKHRGWVREIPLLRKAFNQEPLIIATVRPITEILASFILVFDKAGSQSKIEKDLREANRPSNIWTKTRLIWERYVYSDWRALKTGYELSSGGFLLIEYDDIVCDPVKTCSLVQTYLGVSPWAPSTTNLKNPNPENDFVYGVPGLHDIRPEVKRTSPPAEEVLGQECFEFWKSKKLEFWKG